MFRSFLAPFRTRSLALILCAALLVIAAIVLAGCGKKGGDTGGGGQRGETFSTVVGPEGGSLTVPTDDGLIGGLVLDAPMGAVSEPVELTVRARGTIDTPVREVAEAEPEMHLALVGFALDNLDLALMHPLYGPLFALSEAEFAGPAIELGPEGLAFNTPVTVEIPLSLLGIDDPSSTALPMLRQPDGSWEVVRNYYIDPEAGVAVAFVDHFSIMQWPRNLVAAPGNLFAIWAFDGVERATAKLPKDTFQRFVQGAVCSGKEPGANLSNIPGLPALLDYLGFERGALRSGQETALRTWITDQFAEARAGTREFNSISLGDLFGKAMELSEGDIFQSLVTAHNVLRDNRDLPSVQDMIENYRGDGGDERGARYHLFGMALYSFAYEYFLDRTNIVRGTGQLVIGTEALNPRIVATIEESIVSGDILTDVTEYAVDLQGADLGRELYRQMRTAQTGDLVSRFAADPDACNGGGGGGWAVYRITNYRSAEGGYLTVAQVGIEEDPPLLSSYPGGGIDPELRAVMERLDADASFAAPEDAASSICGSLTDFFRPVLASFIQMGHYNGVQVGVDGIFVGQCE